MKLTKAHLAGAILALGTLGLSAGALAGELRAWYYDPDSWFVYGDLSYGYTKLNVPASACGRRFELPSYYRWVGQYGNTISSHNLNSTVEIWVPKPGCPYNELVFKVKDGQAFNAPAGTHYLELFTNYGAKWIDADGKHLACNACTSFNGGFTFNPGGWGSLGGVLRDLKPAVLKRDPRGALQLLSEAEQRMPALIRETAEGIQLRRRTPLGEFEAPTRALEDAAQAQLQAAAGALSACRIEVDSGMPERAYVGCDEAHDALEHASELLEAALAD